MDCSSFSDNLYDYIDGNLPKEMQQEMNEHCASCPACKELVTLEKKIHQSLQGLPQPKIPKDFAESINQRININERKHKIFLLQRIVKNPVMYSAIAVCLLLAVVLQLDFPLKKEDNLSEDLNPQVKMAQETQTVSGSEAADIPAIAETAIPTDAASIESPAPEDGVIPTEAPTTTVSPKPTTTPKPTSTTTPTQAPFSTPVPPQSNTTVAPAQTPIPVVQEQAPSVASYQAESEESATASGGGGGSSSVSMKSDAVSETTPKPTPAVVIGRITVKTEQYSDAKRLAAQYGNYSNHIYEMSQSQMNQFLKAMKDAGINYVDRASGTTKFRLVSE